MHKSILSLAVLASALAFGTAAFADETETAVNRESLRVAAGITPTDHAPLGYGVDTGVHHGFSGAQKPEHNLSDADRALFKLGDRGLGNS
ncbi:hypothetical protein FHT36_004019 [Xanthobacter sp. SG618]|uniref:hypothetical protein n=1 Tax=Xanthobacter sp. SG618 TaxID=2587121 RepID=UPI00145F1DCB|nr:hypothetical protein [Xanthobacter sp. SG618]NMN60100.1 hypothetical protein [Xanthobacter sp. SG618]